MQQPFENWSTEFPTVQLPEGVPPFIHICQNDFLGRKYKKLKEEDIVICDCKYNGSDPDSACGERCLNLLTSTECTPGYCPCGDYCRNQRFQKCEYANTKLFKTEGRGWGLLADENIKAGQFIIEYCGEVISSEEAKKRSQAYEAQGLKDAYIISLNANYFIDATRKGSLGRFINHSCQPNCETRKWTVMGEIRVGIFAKHDIHVGTELAYDYNFEWFGGATVRCLCGATNCSIFLGAKSPAFLEKNHVWEEGDDRYRVEEVPLYDSAEDEPSLLVSGESDFSAVPFAKMGSEHLLGSGPVTVEPQYSVPSKGVGMEKVKIEDIEEKKLFSQGTLPKKRSPHFCNKRPRHTGAKQVDGKTVAQLFASEEVQEEIIKCEEIKMQAASKLDSLYDEIRPAINEHERDSQDNVDIGVAQKWISASCAKMKAEFDFHFSIVRNVLCRPPQRGSGEAKPSEGAYNNDEIKYLTN